MEPRRGRARPGAAAAEPTMTPLIRAWLALTALGSAVAVPKRRPVLRFNERGEFSILQFADLHFASGARSPCSGGKIETVDKDCEKPTLQIYIGYVISGRIFSDYNRRAPRLLVHGFHLACIVGRTSQNSWRVSVSLKMNLRGLLACSACTRCVYHTTRTG